MSMTSLKLCVSCLWRESFVCVCDAAVFEASSRVV